MCGSQDCHGACAPTLRTCCVAAMLESPIATAGGIPLPPSCDVCLLPGLHIFSWCALPPSFSFTAYVLWELPESPDVQDPDLQSLARLRVANARLQVQFQVRSHPASEEGGRYLPERPMVLEPPELLLRPEPF